MIEVVSIVGTRADIIKMSLLLNLLERSENVVHTLIYSNQHGEMGIEKLQEFGLQRFIIIEGPKNNINELSSMTSAISRQLRIVRPLLVIVHGDTLTALSGALAAHNENIKLAHVEAGLRSGNIYSPYPEELNRTVISKIASLHFCPTEESVENLLVEGIAGDTIYHTGNTIVDVVKSFMLVKADLGNRVSILVTTHRRESWIDLPSIMCDVIKKCVNDFPNVEFIILSHPNPIIYNEYKRSLKDVDRVDLSCGATYVDCLTHIYNSSFIATDSCGIQEEASILGKPTLILRNETERPESLDFGCAVLSGVSFNNIYEKISSLILNQSLLDSMKIPVDAFGVGNSSLKIQKIIESYQGGFDD